MSPSPSENLLPGDMDTIVSHQYQTDYECQLANRVNRLVFALIITEAMFDLEREENEYLRRPWWRKL